MEILLLLISVSALIGGLIVLKQLKIYRRTPLNIKEVEDGSVDIPSDHRNISISQKREQADYESLFVKVTPVTGRKEKITYLRSQFYKKIQNIILCYDNPNLSVFGYIDTVLSHHFEMYESDIKEILKPKIDE
ncbi:MULTISPECIES: DUF3408 domain-containing protein [Dysgonomonas]|uniref:DUF3408 domain-containing protein n=1 Tax=Dysgonomonas TaxID=156973 RepID=UPI0009295D1E|nr:MULTISPECIES: DUF3408 domain-containing protein [Dysgonomonas]MBN9300728.1 DUF3408 domain-containing protein [Dysgonomonas mossii]OJX59460.1 MAG: hypothetical protein BGO84_11955 [Dysgonomonas sp. 37-18]